MSFHQLLQSLQDDTALSLRSFLPELAICVTIVLMLLVRLFSFSRRVSAFYVALIGSTVAFYLASFPSHRAALTEALGQWIALPSETPEIFTGMLVYDELTVFFRCVLLFFVMLFVVFTRLSGIPDPEDGPDFYTLVLGSTLGMCLMASSNHLLMVFLGVEMASVPSYALAGMLKGRRQSSEAALKYAVYGAGSAGVMLYGISLLAGVFGTAHIPTMAMRLAEAIQTGAVSNISLVLSLAGMMVAVGVAFKLAAVPFHFWCPDVFEGASAEVNAFLSVASKAAALALLLRLAIGFGYADQPASAVASPDQPSATVAALAVAASDEVRPVAAITPAEQSRALRPVRDFLVGLVSLLAAVTCTFGNLAAYGQTNIKRLLAYSTIAHAGYMMMPVAAAITLLDTNLPEAQKALGALCFYIVVYLFMNLGAFAVVAFLRNAIRSEEIADYAGLIRRAPGVVICFSIILLSLLGLPPLAGFPAKFNIFYVLVPAQLWLLLVIGGLNTVLSLFYYLRVVKVMILDPEPDDRLPVDFPLASMPGAYLVAVTLPVLALGIWWNDLNEWTRHVASSFLT